MLTADLSVWYQESGGGVPDDPKIQVIPELSRTDADVSLFFLEAAGIGYIPQVDDPWYSAHIKGYVISTNNDSDASDPGSILAYLQDEAASVMGCTTQIQFCYPGRTDGPECLPMSGLWEVTQNIETLWANSSNETKILMNWASRMIYDYHVPLAKIVDIARDSALLAKQHLGPFSSLPDDQWEKEVLLWSSASVTSFQSMYVQMAMGSKGLPQEFTEPPKHEMEWKVCRNQVRWDFNLGIGARLTDRNSALLVLVSRPSMSSASSLSL